MIDTTHRRAASPGTVGILLVICLLALCACAAEEQSEQVVAEDADVASGMDSILNPVQQEMRLLNDALRNSVTAITNNVPQTAVEPFERVHAAREKTEAFLHSGSYAALADADSVAAFAAMDSAFHVLLEEHVHALQAGEPGHAAESLTPLVQSCIACHDRFRFRVAPAK